LFCVLFLQLWDRSLARDSRLRTTLALGTLFIAMFSKEGWAAMVPLGILLAVQRQWSWERIARRSIPLLVMIGLYATLWLSNAHRNFFIVDGHYTLSWHALTVYANTFARLVAQVAVIAIALQLVCRRSDLAGLVRNRAVQFFFVMVALSIVPYSFLTYLDHIPSRNTYLPSVGVAGLAGILYAFFLDQARNVRRRVGIGLFAAILVMNSVYIWIKKEPQFRERAAPTRELLAILNERPPSNTTGPIHVCGFPLHVSIGQTAVEGFTPLAPGSVVFQEQCEGTGATPILQWDAARENYTRIGATVSSGQ